MWLLEYCSRKVLSKYLVVTIASYTSQKFCNCCGSVSWLMATFRKLETELWNWGTSCGPDNAYPSLELTVVRPSPLTMWSPMKFQKKSAPTSSTRDMVGQWESLQVWYIGKCSSYSVVEGSGNVWNNKCRNWYQVTCRCLEIDDYTVQTSKERLCWTKGSLD